MPLPQIAHGPVAASPTYGQERIVGKIYEGNIWFYRVERRLRKRTTPGNESHDQDAVQSPASQSLRPIFKDKYASSSTESSREPSISVSISSDASGSTHQQKWSGPSQHYLIPPEDILEHVSAAELEHFENNLVRQEELEAENNRRLKQEKRQRAIDRRDERARAARAAGLRIDMKHEELVVEESEGMLSKSSSSHGMCEL